MSQPISLANRVDGIVIGASAGGVEALLTLLPSLPGNAPCAVIIVLHLPRDRPSLLAEIFRPKCRSAVQEACDKDPVEPGTVYFAPPDYHLLVDAGPTLALSVDEPVNYSRPSIDVLFESAADVYGTRLLGMILSGASEDGAAGLQAINRAGGLTVVQAPESAQVAFMPEAALRRTSPTFVLDLDRIAALLRTLDGSSLGLEGE